MAGFAKNAYGEVVGFDAHTYHTIIVGATRSGKSSTAYMMLFRAAQDPNLVIVGIDPSGLTLAPFEDCGQSLIATGSYDPSRYVEILENLTALMDARTAMLRRCGTDKLKPSTATPTVLVVLEEYAGILATCDSHDSGAKPAERIKPLITGAVGRLLREGAKCQIFVWCILQRPDATLIGGGDRAQYSRRITHRLDNRDGVTMLNESATEEHITKILTFPTGVGLLNEPGEPYRYFRSAYLPYAEYLATVAYHYQPNNRLWQELAPSA